MKSPPTHTADLLEQAASLWGDKHFLVEDERTLSFNDALEAVKALACGLIGRGAQPETRIALWAPNCVEWVISALAIQYLGGTLVTLNTRYRGHEAAQILRLSGSSLLISVDQFLGIDYPALLEGEDCGAEPDEYVRAESGVLLGRLTLEPDDCRAERGQEEPSDNLDFCHTHLGACPTRNETTGRRRPRA